jgi:alpha-D-xyloside xylohydrolase
MITRLRSVCLLAVAACGASAFLFAAPPVEKLPDGILLPVGGGFLKIQVKTDAIVRVLFSKDRHPGVDNMVVIGPGTTPGDAPGAGALNPFLPSGAKAAASAPLPKWTLSTNAARATLATSKLRVSVSLADGVVSFADVAGRPILAESGRHQMTPATVQGESTYNVQQMWRATPDESLYGLGQRQEGKLDIKGYDFDLWQRNTVVEIPFLVSSRGYGILWDNTSFTKFGDIRPFEPVPASNLIDSTGTTGGLSQGTFVSGSDQLQEATTTATIAMGQGVGVPAASRIASRIAR